MAAKQQFCDQIEPQIRELAHNGATGTVEQVTQERLTIRLDAGPTIQIDASTYTDSDGNDRPWAVEHAYAMTAHKAQGMTVDRAHVVVSGEEEREWAYVALSRHRETVHIYATNEALGKDAQSLERAEAAHHLGRAESKDLAIDYAVSNENIFPTLEAWEPC